MENFDRKKHWETIYQTKELKDVSWYQPTPVSSMEFIQQLDLPKHAAIIDVGGGDGFLVDNVLEQGYTNITVLDISEAALNRAKQRLGNKAEKVKWIVADIADFSPSEKYDLWHDRAAFHFLTNENEIENYTKALNLALNENGFLVIGTFSEQGPKKCSAIEIRQYTESMMSNVFSKNFKKLNCITVDHHTPFDTKQNFLFCSFQKRLA